MRFVFFGDSISVGQCISPHLTWVSRVSSELHRVASARDLLVTNSSVNGNTTRMALERVGNDLQAVRPDVVFLQFGLNDCNCWASDEGHPRVSLKAYAANLQEMMDRARIFGAAKILIATNHLTQPEGPVEIKQAPRGRGTFRERVREYNEAVRKVADSTGAIPIDVERAWIDGPEKAGQGAAMLALDGLHLSLVGHEFYFGVMSPICLEALHSAL